MYHTGSMKNCTLFCVVDVKITFGVFVDLISFLDFALVLSCDFFFQCWLKKQRDSLAPERQDAGVEVRWTSGLIFGKGEVRQE